MAKASAADEVLDHLDPITLIFECPRFDEPDFQALATTMATAQERFMAAAYLDDEHQFGLGVIRKANDNADERSLLRWVFVQRQKNGTFVLREPERLTPKHPLTAVLQAWVVVLEGKKPAS